MPIITAEDVAKRLRRAGWDPLHLDICNAIIEGLEGELSEYMGKELQVGQHVATYPVTPAGEHAVTTYLPKRPVTGLVSVRRVDVNPPEVLDASRLTVHPWGVSGVPSEMGVVEFTYTAGIDGAADPLLRGLVLRAAAREMRHVLEDNEGLRSMAAEGTRYDYVNDGEGGFTEAELAKVKRRSPVVVA